MTAVMDDFNRGWSAGYDQGLSLASNLMGDLAQTLADRNPDWSMWTAVRAARWLLAYRMTGADPERVAVSYDETTNILTTIDEDGHTFTWEA